MYIIIIMNKRVTGVASATVAGKGEAVTFFLFCFVLFCFFLAFILFLLVLEKQSAGSAPSLHMTAPVEGSPLGVCCGRAAMLSLA